MEVRAGAGHGGSVSCILDCILKQRVMVRPQKETPYETEELGWRGGKGRATEQANDTAALAFGRRCL